MYRHIFVSLAERKTYLPQTPELISALHKFRICLHTVVKKPTTPDENCFVMVVRVQVHPRTKECFTGEYKVLEEENSSIAHARG